jgi:predicted O-methyltransferase YrrM
LNTSEQWLKASFYVSGVDVVRRNFSEWQHVRIIEGAIPETLKQIDSKQIAFAHIDMNNSAPEVAAAEFIWPRLVRGGMILLDDYAFYGYRLQKLGMDEFARHAGTSVLSLPTGQGLIIKAS